MTGTNQEYMPVGTEQDATEELELSQNVLDFISRVAAESAAKITAQMDINEITSMAARIASETASVTASREASEAVIKAYDRRQDEEGDRFYRDEETAIRAYRDMKLAIRQEGEFSYEEKTEIRWAFMKDCMEMVNREPGSLAEKYERALKFKQALVSKIDMGVSCLDISSQRSNKPEDRRKYRILKAVYIDSPGISVEKAAELESIGVNTAYTDLHDAIELMLFYTGPLGFLLKPLGLRKKKRKIS